jgi:hypothetical protein
MRLRNSILAGLVLSVFTIAFTFGSALLNFPKVLAMIGAVVLWYGFAAIRRTPARTEDDASVLHRGMKWGVAIGCTWIAASLAGIFRSLDLALPIALAVVLLPFVAGASSAIPAARVRIGLRVGFWSGMVGGLIGFLVFATGGYLYPILTGAPVFATMEANEYGALEMGLFVLFLYGPIFCPVAGTIGGWIGIQLEKTGRVSPVEVPPARA